MTRILAITAAVLAAVAVGIASYAAVNDNGSSKTIVRPVTVSGTTPTAVTPTGASPATVYQDAYKGVVEITVSTSSVCCATEKMCAPWVWPFQRATRASPWAMSSISTSSGEGSSRSNNARVLARIRVKRSRTLSRLSLAGALVAVLTASNA